MRVRDGRCAALRALAVLLGIGALAWAAEAPKEPPGGAAEEKKPARVKETVVTATGLERPTSLEPVSVFVLDRQDLRRINARTVGDALRWVPGANISGGAPFAAASRTTALLQGLPSQYSLILVDGQRAKSDHIHTGVNLELIPVDTIDRIEVIRGPGSVVHGSDALGGIVNIITRPVPETTATGLSTTYGSANTFDSSLYHGGRAGGLGYLFTGARSRSDGVGHGNENAYERHFARLKLFAEPVESLRTTLDLSYYDGDYATSEDEMYTSRLGMTVGDPDTWGRLTASVGYSDYHRDFKAGAAEADNDMWEGRVQYDYQLGDRHYLIVGAEFRREDFERLATTKAHDSVRSLYAQDEVQLAETLTLLVGARLDDSRGQDVELSPRAALHWSQGPTDLRLSVAKGFRLPSLQDLYEYHYDHTTFWRDGNPDLKPETSLHVSLDAEHRLLAEQLLLHAFVFRNEIDDMIVLRHTGGLESDGDPVLERANLQEAYTQGFEVGVTARPAAVEGLRADVSYAYLDAKDETTHDYLAYNPRNTVKAGVSYRRGTWWGSVLAQYVANRYYRDKQDEIADLPNYYLVDLNVGVDVAKNARLSASVKNLFDKEFETYEEAKAFTSYGRFLALTFEMDF